MCVACGAAVSSGGDAEPAPQPKSQSAGRPGSGQRRSPLGNPERRQTTVLFCDLVDSTSLSVRLDPEDLREVLHAFRDCARDVIARHAGFIVSYMGDGVLALFSYPVAHEDDAARAVRAGLELVSAVSTLDTHLDVKLHARVGLATGVVVIDPLLVSGTSFDEVVFGQTTNLAARLQSGAAPDTVVISEVTKRLVEESFECSSLGASTPKGFDKPVPLWQVLRERREQDAAARAPRRSADLPLVGREQELAALLGAWQAARNGSGQLVVIQGEAGVGKSRLIHELRQRLAAEPHSILRYQCAPRFQDSALFPVIRQIERASAILPDDTPDSKLDKLADFVVRTNSSSDDGLTRVLASLLDIPFGARLSPFSDSAERLKQRTFFALKQQFYSAARVAPLLVLVEDLHWADPTTIELLHEIVASIAERPILVLITVRPGASADLPKYPTTLLDLARLDHAESERLVRELTRDKPLAAATVEHILAKGEGVPLFVEELTKAMLEAGALSPEGGGARGPELGAIPSALQDSLAARLDRISDVKDVVHVASAIGREFTRDLLAAVLEVPEAEVASALTTLAEADIVRVPADARAACSFKHVLLQDAAYAMMLRSTRRELHQRIGAVLEERVREGRAEDPAVLAHHFREAGAFERAISYLREAARVASAHAAHMEARRHLLRALELVARLEPSPLRDEHDIDLSVALGLATSATQGYAAPEVEAAYRRSLELCRKHANHAVLFPALRGLCTFYIVRAELGTARDLAEECVRVAEQSGSPADLIESATALGYTLVYQGALAAGREQLERAIALYRAHDGETLAYPSLQDPGVASLSLQAIVAWMMGEVHRSERVQAEALELAERLLRPFNRAYAHAFAALHGNARGRFAEAAQHAARGAAIAEEHGFPVWLGAASMHGAIARGSEEPAASIPLLTHMLGLWQAGGAELNRPFFLWGLALCQRAAGDMASALVTLDEADAQAKRSGEAFLSSEHHRLRGEIHGAASGGTDPRFREEILRAAAVAREQGACELELRALLSLGEPRPGPGTAELARIRELLARARDAGEDHEELKAAESRLVAS